MIMSLIRIGFIVGTCLAVKFCQGNTLIVKLNSMDCVTCFFGLNQVNFLKSSVELKVLISEYQDTSLIRELVSPILERNWEFLVSSSMYRDSEYNRSSYYLYTETNEILVSGHLDQIDISKVNFICNTYGALDTSRVVKCSSGQKFIKFAGPDYIVAYTVPLNSYEIIDLEKRTSKKVSGSQFDPLLVYKVMNLGDTNGYWSRVVRRAEDMKKYRMYGLKLESLSIKNDSCFFFANFFMVEKVKSASGYDNYFLPRTLLLAFKVTQPDQVKLLPILDLPHKFQKRYAIDNTQPVLVLEHSADLLVGVYKDDLRGKKPIFAHYSRNNGKFLFKGFSKHRLPRTFVEDKMGYESNFYDISDNMLLFVSTGDYINLNTDQKGNIGLGKIKFEKKAREVKVTYDWHISGFGKIASGSYIMLYMEEGALKGALLQSNMEVSSKWELKEIQNIGIGSNVLVRANGIILFVDKEGYLVSI
jgi:hypothetical protein